MEYFWVGASITKRNGKIAKLDSYEYAEVTVRDKQGQETTFNDFLDWFVPKIADSNRCEDGPYFPGEAVHCQVRTVEYELPKQTYLDAISYALRSTSGYVVNRSREIFDITSGEHDDITESGNPSGIRDVWNVSVPARAFLEEDPKATVYATDASNTERTVTLPNVSVYIPISTTIENTSVDRTYFVEKPVYEYERAVTAEERDSLRKLGYEVHATPLTGTEYQLERRSKVQKAKYEIMTQSFRTSGRRSYFLEMNPAWQAAGTESTTRRWTSTERVWRNSKSGSGQFTGSTREVRIQPAMYRTENQYRYQTRESYQTTVWETVQVEETVTETIQLENCTPFGCREYTTTRTYTVTSWETRAKTVTRYRTVTHTYWSTVPWSATHEATGETRQVKVRNAEYETQYEFTVERHHEETETTYFANRRKQIRPPKYEWRNYRTVRSKRAALMYSSTQTIKIEQTRPVEEWELRRTIDSTRTYVTEIKDESNVIRTIARGEIRIIEKFRNPKSTTSSIVLERNRTLEERLVREGFMSSKNAKKILNRVVNRTTYDAN